MKILIADDHPLVREALLRVLGELGEGVTGIEAGDADAVRWVAAEHPDLDLVLLDLCLPGVRGLDLFHALRRDYPALPLVVLSALDDPGTVKAVLAGGALGFIPKSTSHPVMVQALRLVLSGGRYLPPELMPELSGEDWAARTPPAESPAGPGGIPMETLGLTGRQQEVLTLLAQGKSNKQICRALGLAEATVKIHVTAVLKALRVTSRTQAVVAINRLGLRIGGPGGALGEPPPRP